MANRALLIIAVIVGTLNIYLLLTMEPEVVEFCTVDYCMEVGDTYEQLGLEPNLTHYHGDKP